MYQVQIGKIKLTSTTLKGMEKQLYTYLSYGGVKKTLERLREERKKPKPKKI